MKILDLFAGIGGFSLAAHWMGWQTTAFVEWDKFNQKVLKKNFPNTPIYGDIREFDGTKYRGTVDLICGGFPCQPFSAAGKREGQADDRYLWPEMLRVIREVRPAWVVGENVAGLLSMDGGDVLGEILASLENEGYNVQTFLIPAIATGAPHRRARLWIIANLSGIDVWGHSRKQKKRQEYEPGKLSIKNTSPNPLQQRPQESEQQDGGEGPQPHDKQPTGCNRKWDEHWLQVATRICRVDDGVPRRVDRAKRLKALGNAIVPQVAYEIFKAIKNQ